MRDLKQIRKEINKLDDKILELAEKRSHYHLNREFYKRDNDKELSQNSALFHYIKTKYLSMINHVCKKGNKKEEWHYLMDIDKELVLTIMKRCNKGVDVVRYKEPLGLPIYVKEVEEKKLKELKESGKKMGLEERAVEGMFKGVFSETKRIEEYIKKTDPKNNNNVPSIQRYKAGTKQAKDIMMFQAERKIEELKKEKGRDYSVKVKKQEGDWIIDILEKS